MFLLAGITCILHGGEEFWDYYSFDPSTKSAQATAVYKHQKPDDGRFFLQFKTETGQKRITQTSVPHWAFNALKRDGYVTILYSPDYSGVWFSEAEIQAYIQNKPKGYGVLALGLVLLYLGVVFIINRYKMDEPLSLNMLLIWRKNK
jgi:hypothetical protein